MSGLQERPLWIPVGGMVQPGSIGEELVAGISDLGERERPATTFNQPFKLSSSFTRQHPDLVTYGDILSRPAEELDKFNRRFRLRERLVDYLESQLILPQSRLLHRVYGWPVFPAPVDREQEIVTGVEDVLNQMQSIRRRTVLIRHFGLYDGISRTLGETAKYLEEPVTQKGAQQLEARSFRYLRHPAIARLMREFFVLPVRRIEDLVSKDLSVVEIAGKARREAEQKALDEAWRRARIGEPANNLVPQQITLTREQLEQLAEIPVENLDLKIHIYYDLMRGGIETVGELLGMTKKQLLAVKNIGVKKALQITTRLAEFLKSQ